MSNNVPAEFENALNSLVTDLLARSAGSDTGGVSYSTGYLRNRDSDTPHMARISRKGILGVAHQCFIAIPSGDIFGAAGALKPQKTVAGNLFAEGGGLKCFNEHGVFMNADKRAGKKPEQLAPSEVSKEVNAFLIDPDARTVEGIYLHERLGDSYGEIEAILGEGSTNILSSFSGAPTEFRMHDMYGGNTTYDKTKAAWAWQKVPDYWRVGKCVLILSQREDVRVGRRKESVTNLLPMPVSAEEFERSFIKWVGGDD